MAQVQIYEDIGVGAEVFLPGKRWAGNPLEIGEHGILAIPVGLQPSGFHLGLIMPREARVVVAQKNVGQDKGGYFRHALAQLTESAEGLSTWIMYDPIQVMRAGQNVWTNWHTVKPNRIDCWLVEKDGQLQLWQVGVITNDDGRTFRLLVEPRWKGQVFKAPAGELVAKPDDPKWSALLWNEGESRAAIRKHPDFQRLLADVTLSPWDGSPEELAPPLGPVPKGNFARVDWYIPFAHQKGGGIARLRDGSSVWVLGQDVSDPADKDGIKRLWHNNLISYQGEPQQWGTKKDAPPKLLGVKVGA